jgi:hypothetical protein
MNIRRLLENFQKYLWVERRFNSPYIIKIGVKVPNKPDLKYTSMGKTQSSFIYMRSNNLFDTFISFQELKLVGRRGGGGLREAVKHSRAYWHIGLYG